MSVRWSTVWPEDGRVKFEHGIYLQASCANQKQVPISALPTCSRSGGKDDILWYEWSFKTKKDKEVRECKNFVMNCLRSRQKLCFSPGNFLITCGSIHMDDPP